MLEKRSRQFVTFFTQLCIEPATIIRRKSALSSIALYEKKIVLLSLKQKKRRRRNITEPSSHDSCETRKIRALEPRKICLASVALELSRASPRARYPPLVPLFSRAQKACEALFLSFSRLHLSLACLLGQDITSTLAAIYASFARVGTYGLFRHCNGLCARWLVSQTSNYIYL